MIALEATPRLTRRARLRYDHARDRWLLLWAERGLVLNGSALRIVRGLAEGRTLAGLAASLTAEAAQRDEVIAFVRELARRGLVEPAP